MSASIFDTADKLLNEFAVDGVVPRLDQGSLIPIYEPKQRDKYSKRQNMTKSEKAARRREQNRLASKRARLKKSNQRKFLKKFIGQLRQENTKVIKRLEIQGINPAMFAAIPDADNSNVQSLNQQALTLVKRFQETKNLLDSATVTSATNESLGAMVPPTAPPSAPATTTTVPPAVASMPTLPPLQTPAVEPMEFPVLKKPIESQKEKQSTFSMPAYYPTAPAAQDCYACSIMMQPCRCGGVEQTCTDIYNAFASPSNFNAAGWPSTQNGIVLPPPPTQMGGFSSFNAQQYQGVPQGPIPPAPMQSATDPNGFQMQFPAPSKSLDNATSTFNSFGGMAPGGYMGYSDAYVNTSMMIPQAQGASWDQASTGVPNWGQGMVEYSFEQPSF